MASKVAIIGGGWYGCHIASSLIALGFEVRLFEQHGRLLEEASGNNQFRLHLGFHYPRHAGTRIQSRDGFARFLERYSDLSQSVVNNIYAVPKQTSLIDFDTYKLIMTATGIPYQVIDECPLPLADVDGIMRVDERIVLIEKARLHFNSHLSSALSLNTKVDSIADHDTFVRVNGDRFDYVIDATWGHFTNTEQEVYYEPTMLLYFEAEPDQPAITFVDGPLYSIYPTEEKTIYTLSSVPHTPLGHFRTSQEAKVARDCVNTAQVKARLDVMVRQALENVPNFRDVFKFLGPQLSIKTKPIGISADRSCYVGRKGRVFSVLSGKIDTIFFATERILTMIEADHQPQPLNVESKLRGTIKDKLERIEGRG
jgi:hypothetical protein